MDGRNNNALRAVDLTAFENTRLDIELTLESMWLIGACMEPFLFGEGLILTMFSGMCQAVLLMYWHSFEH